MQAFPQQVGKYHKRHLGNAALRLALHLLPQAYDLLCSRLPLQDPFAYLWQTNSSARLVIASHW